MPLVRLSLALAALLSIAVTARAQPNGYVGSNVCRTCHPDVWSTFYKNPHYTTLANAPEPQEGQPIAAAGCETCHGPGKAHVQARGGRATIIAFSQLQPKQILNNCLT